MSPEEIRLRIGQNIVFLRTYYGVPRKALSKLVNIPTYSLRRIENGDIRAKLYDFHLKRIARVFDITVDTLFAEKFQ